MYLIHGVKWPSQHSVKRNIQPAASLMSIFSSHDLTGSPQQSNKPKWLATRASSTSHISPAGRKARILFCTSQYAGGKRDVGPSLVLLLSTACCLPKMESPYKQLSLQSMHLPAGKWICSLFEQKSVQQKAEAQVSHVAGFLLHIVIYYIWRIPNHELRDTHRAQRHRNKGHRRTSGISMEANMCKMLYQN